MTEQILLANQFEAHRSRLNTVAYRMLGSLAAAEDAVQESWLRLNRAASDDIENIDGWLTTVVSRVCLDTLRARKVRREDPPSDAEVSTATSPEHEAELVDSVGSALLVLLNTLTPSERVAFVLHDMFDVPFVEVAAITGRSPAGVRKLASRARARVQIDTADNIVKDQQRQREIVDAFLNASRNGEFAALIEMLDPNAVINADDAAVSIGAAAEITGAQGVAERFSGGAKSALLTLVDGFAGAVWSMGGQPKVVFDFTVENGKIISIEMLSDPALLQELDLVRVKK